MGRLFFWVKYADILIIKFNPIFLIIFMSNSKEIFALALGLSAPWYLESVDFVSTSDNTFQELHIRINFHKGSEFSATDGSMFKCYDSEVKIWRHLGFFQHKCYLHSRVPRIKCSGWAGLSGVGALVASGF